MSMPICEFCNSPIEGGEYHNCLAWLKEQVMEEKSKYVAEVPAVRENRAMLPRNVDKALREIQVYIDSGLLPAHINKPQTGFLIAKRGEELGLTPLQAMNCLYVVHGKVSCDTKTMLGLAYKSGLIEAFHVDATDTTATCMIKRKGQRPHAETFTFRDAEALQLTRSPNYKSQPATMLKWRAITAALRVTLPDAIEGMYTHDEMGLPVVAVEAEGQTHLELDAPKVLDGAGDAEEAPEAEPVSAPEPRASEEDNPPPCPKCKGDMLPVNSDNPKAPLWKCSHGHWDARNKRQVGCDGAVWRKENDMSNAIRSEAIEMKSLVLDLFPDLPAEDTTEAKLQRKAQIVRCCERESMDFRKPDDRAQALRVLRRLRDDREKVQAPRPVQQEVDAFIEEGF